MTGTSDGRWSTTSWGWADDNCVTHYGDPDAQITHRVWAVDCDGEHRGFVVLPVDTDTTVAHIIAVSGFAWDEMGREPDPD